MFQEGLSDGVFCNNGMSIVLCNPGVTGHTEHLQCGQCHQEVNFEMCLNEYFNEFESKEPHVASGSHLEQYSSGTYPLSRKK